MSRGHFIGLNHHRLMLGDRERMARYREAITSQVRPGMRVMDLGTGTGILALWAAEAGAQVVAVEPHDVITVARAIATQNGLADRITFIQGDSREISLAHPVDLVITECMGNFFVTDEMQPVLRDLPRHMAEGGATIPRRISLHLAAATLPLWRELAFWDEPVGGFDFGPARSFADQAAYVIACEPEFVSAGPETLRAFSLVEAPDDLEMTTELEVTRAVTLHGLLGWFDADLGEGITLSTRPGIRTHWGQMAFPLPSTAVKKGDRIAVTLRLAMDAELRCHYTWSGRIVRPGHPEGDVSFTRDTRKRFDALLEVENHS
ncbi:MAG: methyltransferase domain-containing protein [Myxococcota bacterium]